MRSIEAATAPASIEAATAPASIEAATAPASIEAATAPASIEAATAPASIEVATAPLVVQSTGLDTATTPSAVLGVVLVKMRMDKGISQAELASAMGLSASTWSRIEKGDSGLSIDQLKQVSKILGLTPGKILDLADLAEKEAIRQGIRIDQSATTISSLRTKGSLATAAGVAGAILPIFGIPLLGILGAAIAIPVLLVKNINDHPDES